MSKFHVILLLTQIFLFEDKCLGFQALGQFFCESDLFEILFQKNVVPPPPLGIGPQHYI